MFKTYIKYEFLGDKSSIECPKQNVQVKILNFLLIYSICGDFIFRLFIFRRFNRTILGRMGSPRCWA